MAIPNTTPTPNELYNGEMKKMGDTELRIVLIVTRATLGWQVDKNTGMRKQEDWISYYQLKEKSGRGYTSIAKAIDNCIKSGWIEARDIDGNILDTKNKRIGKKIYYRLGRIFLDKIGETSSESEEDNTTSSESEITESEITECEAYKRNTNTKEKLYIAKQSFAVNDLLVLFEPINPSYKTLFANTTQRSAIERMVKEHGEEKIAKIIKILEETNHMKYAPVITTPLQLESKLGQLLSFIGKQKNNNKVIEI